MEKSFKINREQHISFTNEEAQKINNALSFIESLTKKKISPNKFIKTSVIQKTKEKK